MSKGDSDRGTATPTTTVTAGRKNVREFLFEGEGGAGDGRRGRSFEGAA